MKNLYLKDLLLEIPTQVTNTTGSVTDINGLLIQVRTLRQTFYIFRSCWGTAQSGEEKVFYFGCVFPFCCLWPCRSHDPVFPWLSQISALKLFLFSSFISPPRILSLFSSSHFLDIISWFSLFLYISYILISELIPSIQLSFSFYLSEISTWRSHCLNLACLAWRSPEIFWIQRKFHKK